MKRFRLWCLFVAGSALYQAAKPLFGFRSDWEILFDAAYWTAAILFLHWWGNRIVGHGTR
jgi:hypothetical protein